MSPISRLRPTAIAMLCLLVGLAMSMHLSLQGATGTPGSVAIFLTAPAAGSRHPLAPLTLEAVAVDPSGGPITVVEFAANGAVIGRSDRSGDLFATVIGLKVPHRALWPSPTAGTHVLEARALRGSVVVARSEPLRVVVEEKAPPVDPPIDPPTSEEVRVELGVLDPTAIESDAQDLVTFEFRRTGDVSKPLRVFFKTGGTAEWGSDFRVIPGGLQPEPVADPALFPWVQSVVIPAGSAIGKLALAPIADARAEENETLVLAVIPPLDGSTPGKEPSVYRPGAGSMARVQILEGSRPPATDAPWVALRSLQASTSEPHPLIRVRPGVFAVQRKGSLAAPLRVRYAVGGSAQNGEDYPLLDGDLTLGAGEAEGQIVVPALTDALAEKDETVVLKLLDDPAYRIDPQAAWAEMTITDSPVASKAVLNLTAPGRGEILQVGTECTLRCVAVDPEGYLPAVEFRANGRSIGRSKIEFFRAPDPGSRIDHGVVWKVDIAGPILLEAVTVDARGVTLSSEPVMILGRSPSEGAEARLHPADRDPGDLKISEPEWMTFAKYWRHGIPTSTDARPVAVDVLTRAGFLWRSGGGYRFDASLGESTLAWQPSDPAQEPSVPPALLQPGIPPILGSNGTPERANGSYALAERLEGDSGLSTWTIHLGAAAGTRCQAVELLLGPGARWVAASDDGQFDPASGTLRWGPFLDDRVRKLKATVSDLVFPALPGIASFDGDRQRIATALPKTSTSGTDSPTPRLAALQNSPLGDARMVLMGGAPGTQWDLEVSEDMATWRRIGRLEITGASILQSDTDSAASRQRFYRVVPRTP